MLRDDFKQFLDRTHYTQEVAGCGHKVYSPLLGKTAIFLHRNPIEDEQYAYYQRCVERFRDACTKRVLFVLVHPSRKPSSHTKWMDDIKELFEVLQDCCCENFELLAIRLVREPLSSPPQLSLRRGNTLLTTVFMPCLGNHNGVSFEDARDQRTFEALVTHNPLGGERQFRLSDGALDLTQKPVTAAHSSGIGHGHGSLQLRPSVFRRLETNIGFAFDACGLCMDSKKLCEVRSWWQPAEEDAKAVLELFSTLDGIGAIFLPEACWKAFEDCSTYPKVKLVRVMRWKAGSKLFETPPAHATKGRRTPKSWVLLATAKSGLQAKTALEVVEP